MIPAPRPLFPTPEPWRAEALTILRAEGKASSAALAAIQEEARRLMAADKQEGARVVLDLGGEASRALGASAFGLWWCAWCRRDVVVSGGRA